MTEPRLCVTVTGRTMAELRRARDAAREADIVELRLDGVDRPDPTGAIEGRRCPVILTCRPSWEGGAFVGTEADRRHLLRAAAEAGAEFIDVEASAPFADELIGERAGRGIVLSLHVFGEPPADLGACYEALCSRGAEVVKLAVEVSRLTEMLPLFALARRPEDAGPTGHVLVAMGAAGVASRVLAARLGNRWTYAGDNVAPGQLPVERVLNDFRFRRIRGDAAVYGVVGNPVGHSRSPAMHNAGFASRGLNAAYVPLQAQEVSDFVRFARSVDLAGASVTAPFKVALMAHLDEVDPLAVRVGAINTLVVRHGRWVGANTDIEGFLASLSGKMELTGARATVLGAGGAARAVAVALADHGARVAISARRVEQGRSIAALVGGVADVFPPPPGSWDLLVNATPAGSAIDPGSPMGTTPLDGRLVTDLVYAPAETRLLADARAAGCATIGGLEMLVAQAERQFELWTGQRPPEGLYAAVAAGVTAVDREQP